MAHELAHQWWGDCVTCRHWSEGWLNEGFATYSEIVWLEKDQGADHANYARLEQMVAYQIEDGRDYRRSIVQTNYRRPDNIFDRAKVALCQSSVRYAVSTRSGSRACIAARSASATLTAGTRYRR